VSEDTSAKRFTFQSAPLAGMFIVLRKPIEDHRGFFSRFFSADEFCEVGFTKSVVQINHNFTRNKGTVRGLHFQYPPHAEVKIVSCIRGEIFDVAIDIRKNSPTFLQWHSEILTAANQKSLLIPEGFAHGFQTLCDNCELIYLVSSPFHPQSEGALNATDKELGIVWPLKIMELSQRDKSHPYIDVDFKGIAL
jgi:dTDP-4-dehydrorhamnose 3,5-epimerase